MSDDGPDDPEKKLAAIRAAASDPEAKLAALRSGGTSDDAPSGIDWHTAYKSGALDKWVTSENLKDEENAGPTTAGALATMASGTPMLSGPMTSMRALYRGNAPLGQRVVRAITGTDVGTPDYNEAYQDITGQERQIPTAARIALKMAGGAPSAALLGELAPGLSAAQGGALMGGSDALMDANPHLTPAQRISHTLIGTAGGAALGKAADMATTGFRLATARDPSTFIDDLKDVRSAADQSPVAPSYATAGEQGEKFYAQHPASHGQTSPAEPLTSTLDSRTIKPYADKVRDSELGQGMTPAEVAEETHKLMSEAQSKKITIGSNGDYMAATDFDIRNLGAGKERLRQAMSIPEPDFPSAVAQHAELSQPITAARAGAAAMDQTLGGPIKAKNLGVPAKDPTAYLRQTVPTYTPEQATAAATEAVRQGGSKLALSVNPATGFGIGRQVARAAPLIQGLDMASANPVMAALRAATRSGAGLAVQPNVPRNPLTLQAAQAKQQIDALPLSPEEKMARKAEVDRRVHAMGGQ